MTSFDQERLCICLAGSGGGHLRQLLDLESFWSAHKHFFVTEDTALGRSIAGKHETEFVPHFALGQAKLGHSFLMLRRAFTSLWASLAIIRRRRPDIVITTGAGSQLFIVLWARLYGAKVVLVDSFARFKGPSAFARLAGPLAHLRVAQSQTAASKWRGAIACDPLRETEPKQVLEKHDLLFATVGATLPFPRLVRLVLDAKRAGLIPEEVLLQTGEGAASVDLVEGIQVIDSLPFDQMRERLAEARLVVCHGGTGSIITALQAQCGTVVVPRRFDLGEHYDNHQSEVCEAFANRGLVHVAEDAESFAAALLAARQTPPRPVRTDYGELVEILQKFVANS